MTILLAPDKFKGSLSVAQVCQALAEGIGRCYLDADIIQCPLADGGDGSLDVLAQYLDLDTVNVLVADPLGRPLQANYRRAGTTAYVELAAASGLVLLGAQERSAMDTSTLGTGQLIAHALDHGVKEVYLFIGGSATNDGGMGIAQALGYRFLDNKGQPLAPIGRNLSAVAGIDRSRIHPRLQEVYIKVVGDVDNPFYGPRGAAYVYAPQKGATAAEVSLLDQGLQHFAEQLMANGYPDIRTLAGAGAAGGVGGGTVALLSAELVSGTQTFMELSQLTRHIQAADLVITGEGKLDAQTQQGKLISGVCALAREHRKPVIGVCGAAEAGVAEALGLAAIFTILERSSSVEEAMNMAYPKLVEIGQSIKW
ncbi:MAG: glycerate kinase [Bacteroidetes bacterium]|nr:MAG: glycerate kinase [Bacteroidota bacterium]